MANDRIYLVCTKCDAEIMLLKYYPSGSSMSYSSQELEDFMVEHLHNCQGRRTQDLGGSPCFHLDTESGWRKRQVTAVVTSVGLSSPWVFDPESM